MLRRYKWEIVRPALREYDTIAFTKAAEEVIPSFGLPFLAFQQQPLRLPLKLLDEAPGRLAWTWLPVRLLTRISGRWPLCISGSEEMPDALSQCAARGTMNVTVVHALAGCT